MKTPIIPITIALHCVCNLYHFAGMEYVATGRKQTCEVSNTAFQSHTQYSK